LLVLFYSKLSASSLGHAIIWTSPRM